MMQERDRAILDEFAACVRRVFPEARIWAFGSRARGDGSRDSDLDICVVLDDGATPARKEIQQIAWEVGFAHGLVLTVLCYAEAEFTNGPRAASPLIRNILSEGVVA